MFSIRRIFVFGKEDLILKNKKIPVMWAKLFQDLLKDCDREIYSNPQFIHGRKQSNSKSNGCVLKLGNVIEEKI